MKSCATGLRSRLFGGASCLLYPAARRSDAAESLRNFVRLAAAE